MPCQQFCTVKNMTQLIYENLCKSNYHPDLAQLCSTVRRTFLSYEQKKKKEFTRTPPYTHAHTHLDTATHLQLIQFMLEKKKNVRPNYACKRCLSLSFRYTNIYIIYADLWKDKGEGRKTERCRARASHHLSSASLIYLHFLYISRNDWYASWGVIQLTVKLLNKTLVWQNICKQIKEQAV